jgi:hypothetical protein
VDIDRVCGSVDAVFEGEGEGWAGVVLAEGEGECFFVRMVLPADVEVGVAGLVEPLVEEAFQVFAADGFHGLLEIGAGSVAVAVG